MTLTEGMTVPVDSTLLASVRYDAGGSILRLEFRDGAIYRYFAVPAAIHNGLLAADSKGSYFNQEIRNSLHFIRLRRPR
jgi:hypothetical protein